MQEGRNLDDLASERSAVEEWIIPGTMGKYSSEMSTTRGAAN
jgi:hypothetical protein